MALIAAWALAWAVSLHALWSLPPSGDGFTRGLNRAGAFLGWQAIAGLLALGAFGLGRAWPRGTAVRRLSRLPLYTTGIVVVALAGLVLRARFPV